MTAAAFLTTNTWKGSRSLRLEGTTAVGDDVADDSGIGLERYLEANKGSDNGLREAERFEQTLDYHRELLPEYRWKWAYGSGATDRVPKSTGWPPAPPTDDEVPSLEYDSRFCAVATRARNNGGEANGTAPSSSVYCENLQFQLAQYYLHEDTKERKQRGYDMLKDLAERNNANGMCLYGVYLNEGRLDWIEANPQEAVQWFHRAHSEHKHLQATYELAVAYFTGEGVDEDEEKAVQYFQQAANLGHAGAAYMLGDCLLDGVGIERDRADALEWLVTAGELGHRGARSRVMAVLEKEEGKDYGEFTDASRQTLLSSTTDNENGSEDDKNGTVAEENKEEEEDLAKWTEQDQKKKFSSIERRFTVGSGARTNPVVLARRRTTVQKSRGE